ncbi:MAG: hypothetical protein ACI8VE_001934 [Natrialbaceae archaeon]|jgi:hypothetical protein
MPVIPNHLLLLAAGAVIIVLAMHVYVATGISYRHRDNGLAYILFVLGVAVWNGIFAAQFLSTDPAINQFFLSLSIVGAVLAGLGWFMFASTAGSTPRVPGERVVFATTGVLVGIAIMLAVTTPVHSVLWQIDPASTSLVAEITPAPGYWLYTVFLAGLFLAGVVLFGLAWSNGESLSYSRAYTVTGITTVVAILGSNILAPGGLTVAPLVTFQLATIGWLQAKRWSVVRFFRRSELSSD